MRWPAAQVVDTRWYHPLSFAQANNAPFGGAGTMNLVGLMVGDGLVNFKDQVR